MFHGLGRFYTSYIKVIWYNMDYFTFLSGSGFFGFCAQYATRASYRFLLVKGVVGRCIRFDIFQVSLVLTWFVPCSTFFVLPFFFAQGFFCHDSVVLYLRPCIYVQVFFSLGIFLVRRFVVFIVICVHVYLVMLCLF